MRVLFTALRASMGVQLKFTGYGSLLKSLTGC
jgi:hypothetical protein